MVRRRAGNERRVVAAAAVLLASACGGAGSGAPADSAPPVLTALCAAVASADEPAVAAGHFDADAHGPLHELAAAAAGSDREVAGRLLEAKQRVEAALRAGEVPPDELRDRLEELVASTREALGLLGSPAPSCSDGETDS